MLTRWLKRRLGVLARPVAVRTRMPWPLRWLARSFLLLSAVALGWILVASDGLPGRAASVDETVVTQLRGEVEGLVKANAGL